MCIRDSGRIGRNILRALYEGDKRDEIQIVAINDLGNAEANAHLTKYDTAHGPFPFEVNVEKNHLFIDGDKIKVFAERNPENLPWADLKIDIVLESTGFFASKEKSSAHLRAGAKKVLISAPAGNDIDATIVYGVNHNILKPSDEVVSNASCRSNCLAPLAKVFDESIGIESGIMNTIHSYTNDQVLTDVYHSDLRRARSATQSMIPTKTGAAAAVGLVLPDLDGKLDGFSLRVPTINVSIVDLTFLSTRETSIEEINGLLKSASESELKGVLEYSDEPLVSSDFNHNPASSVYDSGLTRISLDKRLIKVCAWYDNEWGFSNRMLDTALAIYNLA